MHNFGSKSKLGRDCGDQRSDTDRCCGSEGSKIITSRQIGPEIREKPQVGNLLEMNQPIEAASSNSNSCGKAIEKDAVDPPQFVYLVDSKLMESMTKVEVFK